MVKNLLQSISEDNGVLAAQKKKTDDEVLKQGNLAEGFFFAIGPYEIIRWQE